MLIGLMGKKRAGKDSFAQFLIDRHGFTRIAFADRLKQAVLEIDPYVDTGSGLHRLSEIVEFGGWEIAKNFPEVRRLLQATGMAVRNNLHENVWVESAMADVGKVRTPVVITDARFPNEAWAIKNHGGVLVRINRPGLPDDDTHISEHALDDWVPDVVVDNDSDLESLRVQADALIAGLSAGQSKPKFRLPESRIG